MIKPRLLSVCISILISFFRCRRYWVSAAIATAFFVLCATRPALSRPALAVVDLPIYADALADGWQDWSWDTTRSFDNAQPVHSGSASIAVTHTAAWGGLYLHTDTALPANDYTAIRFWVHGGSTGGQSVNFHLNDGEGSYSFTVQANTWLPVMVPFAALGNPTTLSDLVWQDNSGNGLGQPTFYLDDISLIGASSEGAWTAVTSPVTYPLRSVAMLSANDGWAVGYEGRDDNGYWQGSVMLRWNGNTWTNWWSSSTSYPLFSVTMVSANDSWAVGSTIGHYGSTILRWNGSAWASLQQDPSNEALYSVAMVSADDGWAVGGGGDCGPGSNTLRSRFMRWDGGAWTLAGSIPYEYLRSVAMVSANDGWAVGNYCYWSDISHVTYDSVIWHWNGSSWNVVSSPTNATLTSVAMLSATDGWAVGELGTILHWNGSAWSLVSSPTLCDLKSVAMVSADHGWAVGGDWGNYCPSQSVILHWNGNTWSETVSPVSQALNSVTMISADEGWAVGDGGTILEYGTVRLYHIYLPLVLKQP